MNKTVKDIKEPFFGVNRKHCKGKEDKCCQGEKKKKG